MRKVAIVTGATRGIGKACALSLAQQGFDVVVTGRTQKEGEGTATLPFSREGRQVAVPGSLETTVQAVQALGREALPVRMDVLDRSSMDTVIAQTLEHWDRIDVLVNNALYQGPGLMHAFADFSFEQFEMSVLGNLVNQVYMARQVLPVMIRQGGGCIVSLSSNAAVSPPPAPPDKGGWGFVYGAPKAGFTASPNSFTSNTRRMASSPSMLSRASPSPRRPWPCSARMLRRISAAMQADPRPPATWWPGSSRDPRRRRLPVH